MYIAQAFNTLHDWWRYIIGVFIIVVGVFIGQVPFTAAVMIKAFKDGKNPSELNQSVMMSYLEPNLNLFLMLLSFAVGLVALLLVTKYLHKQSFTQLTTSRKQIDWKRVLFIFFFWGIISSGLVIVDYYMTPENYELNFQLKPFIILCIIAIIFVPLQTSFEEYMFRGYLMQGIGVSTITKRFPLVLGYILLVVLVLIYSNSLETISFVFGILEFLLLFALGVFIFNSKHIDRLMNSNIYNRIYYILRRNSTPLIITSAVFGLLHIANPEVEKLGPMIMVYYIGTGLFLGIMTLMDEGMELSLGFHAANNLFTALLVTADWTAFQTHSILKDMSDPSETALSEIFVPVFIVFPIILFILSRIYKWTGWKEKLFGKVEEPALLTSEIDTIGHGTDI
ncbi:CPBP family glutamic-type intramembrane protease [Aestuariibaculum sp. YM273]|uniref:CPBP family glutamic-type intramembrane protease n=1 Tax=Aestuariibaculum sp. YM273 TaxID=3070659 RepID=UPI0027DB0723|nr:CPBP family glutamic-type intramembrane protease [Aestuariibaculum sp. YM273]WMI64693.1 CPBP family glutamic-type intramembrane protease [Aestuariibaculum sp. YM273]